MTERRQNQSRRDEVDFHVVAPEHRVIHERLENWRRAVTYGRGGSGMAPMFKHYRSPEHWIADLAHIPVDTLDGGKMEQEVRALPEKCREAIRWNYVYSSWGESIWKACRRLAVRPDTLQQLVQDGRSMLKNRAQLTNRADAI